MGSTLELDQDDMAARLTQDAVTGLVTVFSQRKGITENDVQTRLGALNAKGGLTGLVLIVLMPKLIPQEANTPGAMYFTRYSVQVIDWPAIRRQTSGGISISAESMAERVRQILHFAGFGRGQSLFFDGMDPLPMADPNQISYAISFRKVGADTPIPKCAVVAISPKGGNAPVDFTTFTLSCATAGAAIYYTTDGSYPGSTNPAAILYTGPVTVNESFTVRAAAERAGFQQSDPASAIFVFVAFTAPTNLASSGYNGIQFTLSWDPSAGGVGGVGHYEVYQKHQADDGYDLIASPTGLSQLITGLDPNLDYTFKVYAIDTLFNPSPGSALFTITHTPASGFSFEDVSGVVLLETGFDLLLETDA